MKTSAWIGLAGFVLGALLAGGTATWWVGRASAPEGHEGHAPSATGGEPSQSTRYFCPMHPAYSSDLPGECPICNMRLVPIEEEPAELEPAESRRIYRSTMNPDEVSDRPGKDSMGMEMVPVDPGPDPAEPAVPGYATVNVPAHKQQYIGVRSAPVERRTLQEELQTVATVAYDETALSFVNTKIAGWIEKLYVDRTGQSVRRGEPLLEIYSPDLVAAQEELLVAKGHLERLRQGGALPRAIEQAEALLVDSRRRLELWDVSGEQIRTLEASGTVTRTITMVAPVSGFVVEKTALLGKQVPPGENLYRIADLSTVWVLAKVYEQDVSRVRPGLAARVTLPHGAGNSYEGRVDYVYPYLDPATRTVDVRIVVPNPDGSLRPEMYANVRFRGPAGSPSLVVPNEAILDTGERRIAFVRHPAGTFEPRELTVGLRTREFTQVLAGLSEGEEVVTSGNFLIDSESRLKAALSGMGGGHKHGG